MTHHVPEGLPERIRHFIDGAAGRKPAIHVSCIELGAGRGAAEMLGTSDQERCDCCAMRARHAAIGAAVLVNGHVAKDRMIALHAAIDQPYSRASRGRPRRCRAGDGSFSGISGGDAAVEIDMVEVVNAAGIELP